MSRPWPTVQVGEVLKLDLNPVVVKADRKYSMVGVYSFGRGLFDREEIEGGNTSYRRFYLLKANHIVMSQLFGWEGALAIGSERFAGKFVSPQFPTFLCDDARLDRLFLGWFMRRPAFWQELGSRTSGMGDRRRTLNPLALFACKISLPPLEEQCRIVTRIEELATKIDEARALRERATEEVETLVTSLHMNLAGSRSRTIADMAALHEDATPVVANQQYPQVGIRSFGGGLFPKPAVAGTQTTYRTFNRLYEGALVLSQVKGWEGAISVCPNDLNGYYVSPEYRTFRLDPTEARPRYMEALVRTQWFWSQLQDATRGVGARRQRTRPEQFLALTIPMPEVGEQEHAELLFRKLATISGLQAETAAELEGLLPAVLDRAFKGEL